MAVLCFVIRYRNVSPLCNQAMLVASQLTYAPHMLVIAPGAEGEAGEAAERPGRPVQNQRGETARAAETAGGGEREEEEGGRGGSQVSVRHSSK